jgi:hypothetical protein
MSPLQHHAHQGPISSPRKAKSGVVRQLLESAVEVIGRRFGGKGELVQKVEKFERGTRFDGTLRRRIKPPPEKLVMVRYGPCTAAVLDGNIVDSVGMQDKHARVAGDRALAEHAAMVELNLQAQRFE